MKTTVKLKEIQVGGLMKFKSDSDVWEVVSNDSVYVELKNKYTGAKKQIKTYTKKGGSLHERTAQLVYFY